jgi:hypothetical protein
LEEALYACFAELGDQLRFENGTVPRVAALDLLTRIEEPQRRATLFMAFVPLWQALNADGGPGSPYRRMMRMAATKARQGGSPIDAAAHTVGVSAAETERWLEQTLDAWRQVSGESVEPWDYLFTSGAADRALESAIPRAGLLPLNERYYRDLGFDVVKSAVIYDIDPRSGKAPLAYTDYVRHTCWRCVRVLLSWTSAIRSSTRRSPTCLAGACTSQPGSRSIWVAASRHLPGCGRCTRA